MKNQSTRNSQIIAEYKELREKKVNAEDAKEQIGNKYGLATATIQKIIFARK